MFSSGSLRAPPSPWSSTHTRWRSTSATPSSTTATGRKRRASSSPHSRAASSSSPPSRWRDLADGPTRAHVDRGLVPHGWRGVGTHPGGRRHLLPLACRLPVGRGRDGRGVLCLVRECNLARPLPSELSHPAHYTRPASQTCSTLVLAYFASTKSRRCLSSPDALIRVLGAVPTPSR